MTGSANSDTPRSVRSLYGEIGRETRWPLGDERPGEKFSQVLVFDRLLAESR